MILSRTPLSRRAVAVLAASIATLCTAPSPHAATYYWDPFMDWDPVSGDAIGDDVLDGGAGVWNTIDANFTTSSTDSSAITRSYWSSALNGAGTDSVIFGGTAGGTITLDTFSPEVLTGSNNLGVNNLTFNTTGYTLQGTNSIRFIGTGASITVSPGVTATINNGIQGSTISGYTMDTDVEINGGGTLRMGGGNGSLAFTIAAGTTVEQTGGTFSGWNLNTVNGTLRTQASGVLAAASGYRSTGTEEGILDLNGYSQTIGNLGGGLNVTNGSAANSISLGLTMVQSDQTHTGVISDGTGGGKLSLFTTGTVAQGIGFQSTVNFRTQTFAGANTFTGSFTHGRGTVVLDFSNAAAPASNIFYNSGFGDTPSGDDGKLIFNRPLGTAGASNSAVGTLATLQITGKADTANVQQFRGLKLNANGAGQIYINPNATGNTVTLDLGSSLERESGGFVNFSTNNATSALSANARILSTAGTAGSLLTSADGVAFATLSGRDWAAKDATNSEIVAATYTPSGVTSFVTGANITTPSAGGPSNDVRLGADTSIASLRYGNTSARSNIMLGGNTLTTGGILISAASDSSGNYLSGGTVTSPGSDVVLAHFAGSSNRWFQMGAVIADGAGGATGFTKAGTGITVLSGDNTFTGELTVQQGGLIVTGTNDGASAVNINGSQTNLMGGHLPGTTTSGSFIQIGNSGPAGTIGSGPVNIGGNAILAVKSSDDITIENTIGGLGGLTQGGSGTTTLVSAATAKYTYVGDTTVTGGTLKLDYSAANTGIIHDSSRLVLGGGTVEYATAANTTHNDTVRGFALISGASTITKTGEGTGRLRMNNVADIGVAGATVNFTAAGVADTDIGTTNGIVGSRARFTVGSGDTYDWATQAGNADSPIAAYTGYTAAATSGTNTNNSRLVNSGLTLTGNLTTNTLKVENTAPGVTQTVEIGTDNTLTLTAGGLLITGSEPVAITGGMLKSNTASNSDLIIHQYNSGGLTIGSVIANGIGNSTLTKSGNGTLTLTGVNTYTGQTFLNGGTTVIASNAALGAVTTGAQINLNNATLRVTEDVILSNGAVGTSNRSIALNGVGGTLEVDENKTLTIGGSIFGSGGLTKTGLGTLEIRSNSTTGPTNVEAGTLRYIASVHNVYSALTVAAGATVDLFGFHNAIGSLEGAGTITNSGTGSATLTVMGLPTNTIFSGQLTQAGTAALNFEKAGPGVLTLTGGTNDTTGSFTISGGTLVLSGDALFTTRTGTSAGAVSVTSAAATLDISGITAETLAAGSIASVEGAHINLGSKILIAGSNNGNTTLAGVISGVGGGLTKTSTNLGTGTLTITGVNTYTGPTIIDQGALRIRDSVLVNTPGPLGNADSAILVGSATSATTGAYSTNLFLNVQPYGDNDQLIFARPIDFSQASANATRNDRSRLRLESNNNGTADMSKLTISGDVTLGERSLELYVDKAGQTMEFTGDITGGAGSTIYLLGLTNTAANGDGASGGTFRFSDEPRTFDATISMTMGRVVIAGSVPATGPSPIGTKSITLGDGNGGSTLNPGATAANRGVFLETPGASYERGLSPGGATNLNLTQTPAIGALYGTGTVRMLNSHQFGGTNTSGTVTFTGNITPGSIAVSVTGTAGGLGGTNPVSTVHNLALIAATGGTVAFDGAISGSTAPVLGSTDTAGEPGSGSLARVTINQVRNHPNIDENRDGFADETANALVGTATAGTVILNATNTYGGTTEVLGGTLLVNGSIAGDSVTVQSGATLGGSGSILAGTLGSTATIHGGIAPGASTDGTGVLTLEKAVTFASGASLTLEINGAVAGEDYDQLAIGSASGITLAGDNPINLTLGYVPAISTVFTLIENFSDNPIGGAFTNLADDSVIFLPFNGNQYAFTVDYQGGSGNDLTLTAVPEPSTAVALLAGVGVLLGVRRRRRVMSSR